MKVILYSGGIDSFIASTLLGDEWTPVYVNMGTRYSSKELEFISASPMSQHLRICDLPLGDLEQDNGFLPQRNLMLLAYVQARFNANEIALCAVKGEYSRDKHRTFFQKASELLSYTAGMPVRCYSPLISMTKTQAVARYLKEGYSADELLNYTVSCYHSTSNACGQCMSCYRRWVALENNGLQQQWDFPPWEWIKTNHAPLRSIHGLPLGVLLKDFLPAQVDAARAHIHLKLRG